MQISGLPDVSILLHEILIVGELYMEELLAYINNIHKIDVETEIAVRKYFVEESFKKNEFLVEKGKTCKKTYFILSGLVRRFYVDEKGEESTSWIYYDKQLVTDLGSFISQNPSLGYMQACVPTKVLSLSFEGEQKLLTYPEFLQFYLKLIRSILVAVIDFHQSFKLMNAQEKYAYLMANFPEMIQKSKLKYIATLLNVSQETLSRIRAAFVDVMSNKAY